MELTKLTISQLINGYKAKQFKPSEVVDSYIKNIEIICHNLYFYHNNLVLKNKNKYILRTTIIQHFN